MTLNIACVQNNPQSNLSENLLNLEKSIDKAVSLGAELIVLPEMFAYMGAEKGRLEASSSVDEGVFIWLSKMASTRQVTVLGGSHAEKSSVPSKVYNTLTVWNPDGKLVSKYRKVHLFNLKDLDGNAVYCESDAFLKGEPSHPYELKFKNGKWKCFNSICYDIRFPELFRGPLKPGNPSHHDIIFVPAAFTYETGKDHWEVLLRCRAIENQCWVVACNQTGYHSDNKKRNYGHSMVIDPWGNSLGNMGEEPGLLMVQISKEPIMASRKRLPALTDRAL